MPRLSRDAPSNCALHEPRGIGAGWMRSSRTVIDLREASRIMGTHPEESDLGAPFGIFVEFAGPTRTARRAAEAAFAVARIGRNRVGTLEAMSRHLDAAAQAALESLSASGAVSHAVTVRCDGTRRIDLTPDHDVLFGAHPETPHVARSLEALRRSLD